MLTSDRTLWHTYELSKVFVFFYKTKKLSNDFFVKYCYTSLVKT